MTWEEVYDSVSLLLGKSVIAAILTLAVLAVAAPAEAGQTDGAILRIEGPEIYAALGRIDGVRAGQTAKVYRRIALEDGGELLEDLELDQEEGRLLLGRPAHSLGAVVLVWSRPRPRRDGTG